MKVLNIFKLGIVLALFAAAACVMLAFVYSGTYEQIEENRAKALNDALKELFHEADRFEEITDITSPDSSVSIEVAYAAIKNDLPYGAALRTARASYSGPIKTIVGVNIDGYITGVKIMEHSDTPGLGANAASPKYFVDRTNGITFYGQFTNKKTTDPFVVNDDIAVITSSTITSIAVSNSVKAAALAASAWFEGKEPDVITGATRSAE
ncbi:MAG: FMN-binding protein [Treponema sp.]|jgi:electron transport complex protein RnfG|nr:FMN-binding protein [Treponema sp.]